MTPTFLPTTAPALTVADWSLLQARLIWAYAGPVAPANRRRDTAGGALFAWRLRRGSVRLRIGRRTMHVGAGEWLLGGPRPHAQEFSDDAEIVSVNFRLQWPSGDALVDRFVALPDRETPGMNRAADKLVRLVARRYPEAGTDLWGRAVVAEGFFEMQACFAEWTRAYLAALAGCGVAPSRLAGVDPRVMEALRELDAHPWGEPFREPELAERLGVSAGHLDRLFTRHCGLTPRAYLAKRRLEEAKRILADRSRPVKQAAFSLGFSGAAHFCRWFRAAAGESPGRWRGASARARRGVAAGRARGASISGAHREKSGTPHRRQ